MSISSQKVCSVAFLGQVGIFVIDYKSEEGETVKVSQIREPLPVVIFYAKGEAAVIIIILQLRNARPQAQLESPEEECRIQRLEA